MTRRVHAWLKAFAIALGASTVAVLLVLVMGASLRVALIASAAALPHNTLIAWGILR